MAAPASTNSLTRPSRPRRPRWLTGPRDSPVTSHEHSRRVVGRARKDRRVVVHDVCPVRIGPRPRCDAPHAYGATPEPLRAHVGSTLWRHQNVHPGKRLQRRLVPHRRATRASSRLEVRICSGIRKRTNRGGGWSFCKTLVYFEGGFVVNRLRPVCQPGDHSSTRYEGYLLSL